MFSKSRINEPGPKAGEGDKPKTPEASLTKPSMDFTPSTKPKAGASILSADLTVVGNLRTSGDIQVEGNVEGDIVADDIVVNGRVIGKVRGLKVRLTSSARVEGDIIHKTIAIESGAHFEGSVQRQDDPLANGRTALPAPGAVAVSADEGV